MPTTKRHICWICHLPFEQDGPDPQGALPICYPCAMRRLRIDDEDWDGVAEP